MSQPNWEFVTNLGDASPLESGGYFLYRDTTGVYGFEAEKLDEPEDADDPKATWTVHRVCLDRYKLARHETSVYLVPYGYGESWKHSITSYAPWFAKDLDAVAATVGASRVELEQALCSEDGGDRAWVYETIASYHGWENFDSEPLTLTRAEVEDRYALGELGESYTLPDAVTLKSEHMRRADYSSRSVILPNSNTLGYGKWKAEPGDLISYRYEDNGPSYTGRVLGRVDAPAEGEQKAIRGWLAVIELSTDASSAHMRWIKPERVITCVKPPTNFAAWFFQEKLPNLQTVMRLSELGSLSESYIAKYAGKCERCIVTRGLYADRDACTHVSRKCPECDKPVTYDTAKKEATHDSATSPDGIDHMLDDDHPIEFECACRDDGEDQDCLLHDYPTKGDK